MIYYGILNILHIWYVILQLVFFLSLARLLHREQGFQCNSFARFQPNAHMIPHPFPS